jgi:alcohol dehydrogenase class IV
VSSPKSVTSATGVDALCHGVEAYLSKKAHAYTDTLALSAIKLIFKNLRTAYNEPNNLEAREKMSLAALKAGSAFSNASVCLVHGMSRPIGALFHVPHGISNAMLLPAVLEFSMSECTERLADIYFNLYPEKKNLSAEAAALHFVNEIKLLCKDLNIPNLKQWGIDKQELHKVIAKMAKDAIASGSPGNNPKVPTEAEIIELYGVCYTYDLEIHNSKV